MFSQAWCPSVYPSISFIFTSIATIIQNHPRPTAENSSCFQHPAYLPIIHHSLPSAKWSHIKRYYLPWYTLSPRFWHFNLSHSAHYSILSKFRRSIATRIAKYICCSPVHLPWSYFRVSLNAKSTRYSEQSQFRFKDFLKPHEVKAMSQNCRWRRLRKNGRNVTLNKSHSSRTIKCF